MKKNLRAVIYTGDVQNITGKSYRTCRKILADIRNHYEKDKRGLITIEEFCAFTKLKESFVCEYIHG